VAAENAGFAGKRCSASSECPRRLYRRTPRSHAPRRRCSPAPSGSAGATPDRGGLRGEPVDLWHRRKPLPALSREGNACPKESTAWPRGLGAPWGQCGLAGTPNLSGTVTGTASLGVGYLRAWPPLTIPCVFSSPGSSRRTRESWLAHRRSPSLAHLDGRGAAPALAADPSVQLMSRVPQRPRRHHGRGRRCATPRASLQLRHERTRSSIHGTRGTHRS